VHKPGRPAQASMSCFKLHACWPQTWAGRRVLMLCLSRTLQAETCLLCSKDIMLPRAQATTKTHSVPHPVQTTEIICTWEPARQAVANYGAIATTVLSGKPSCQAPWRQGHVSTSGPPRRRRPGPHTPHRHHTGCPVQPATHAQLGTRLRTNPCSKVPAPSADPTSRASWWGKAPTSLHCP